MARRNFYYNNTEENQCSKYCSNPRIKHIVLIIVLTLISLGIGFTIGYFTKKDKSSLCISQSTIETISGDSTARTRTSSFPLSTSLTSPSSTATLWSINDKVTMTTFNKYSIEYTSPTSVTNAMLLFEFNTVWGSWYLDDVSMKECGGNNQEMIYDGGFETGNLGSEWKVCDPRYPWIVDGKVVAHTFNSGAYSYESQDPGVGSQEYLTQILNIKSNTKYIIEFYVFYSGQSISASATIISH
ncbi:hypothetical protein I4U23_003047 [Adineta vaga]|nr:hypothetical protein I4U23_003047 [Adineta vaga]